MSYSDDNDLINDASWTGRVQVCIREQASVFIIDVRPEVNLLAAEIIKDPQTQPFKLCYLLATYPGMTGEATDDEIRSAVTESWPTWGQAYVIPEAI